MLFFSDLDRTLIYSKKFIKDRDKLYCIEVLDGKEISYISKNTVKLLKEISKDNKFIPTTTRSIEQFSRIKFNEHGINFQYSITTNGGVILYNGKPLEIWSNIVKKRLKECNSLLSTMSFFNEKYGELEGILKVRSVDEMFFYLVVDLERFDVRKIETFKKELEAFNWNFYISGRKIYFLPKILTKENAIDFLMNYLNEKEFCAMGDSSMDLNMLKKSNRAFVPAKSAIEHEMKNTTDFISKNEGFEGTEEIIKELLNI